MSGWQSVADGYPDETVIVWICDGKTVGISEYLHGIEEWLYCDDVLGPITHWQWIEHPSLP